MKWWITNAEDEIVCESLVFSAAENYYGRGAPEGMILQEREYGNKKVTRTCCLDPDTEYTLSCEVSLSYMAGPYGGGWDYDAQYYSAYWALDDEEYILFDGHRYCEEVGTTLDNALVTNTIQCIASYFTECVKLCVILFKILNTKS